VNNFLWEYIKEKMLCNKTNNYWQYKNSSQKHF